MGAVYLETSALLAVLLGEPRAEAARVAIDAASAVVTSALSFLEIERILVQAERSGELTEGEAQRLRGQWRRLSGAWIQMTLSEEVHERAGRAFPVEPVRSVEALHLATALVFSRAFPDLQVLSFDERILANARALGIS